MSDCVNEKITPKIMIDWLDEVIGLDIFEASSDLQKVEYLKSAMKTLNKKSHNAVLQKKFDTKWANNIKAMVARAEEYPKVKAYRARAEIAEAAENSPKAAKLHRKADKIVKRRLNEWDKDVQSGARAAVDSALVSFDHKIDALLGSYLHAFNGMLDPLMPTLSGRLKSLYHGYDPYDIMREMYKAGGAKGNEYSQKVAQGFAEVFPKIAESLRVRANAAGQSIKFLTTWNLPQTHDAKKMTNVLFPDWFRTLEDTIDKERTIEILVGKGNTMSDKSFRDAMEQVFENLKTGGASGLKVKGLSPEARKSLANMGQEVRVFHFKDAESWISYNKAYGKTNPQQAMINYIEDKTREIAALETFGPNPDAGVRKIGERIRKITGDTGAAQKGIKIYDTIMHRNAGVYQNLIGVARGWRNLIAMSKLTFAPLAATIDTAFGFNQAAFTRVNPVKHTLKLWRAWGVPGYSKQARDQAAQLQILTHAVISRLKSSQRYSDLTGAGTTAVMADFTIRAGGLPHLTDVHQFVYGAELMAAIPRALKDPKGFKALSKEWGTTYGFTAEQMNQLRFLSEDLMDPNGAKFFDPSKIKDQQLKTDFLGMIHAQTAGAVPESSARTRAMIALYQPNNSAIGEFGKTAFQFLNFPLTIMTEHLRFMKNQSRVGKTNKGIAMLATTVSAATVMGLFKMQAQAKLQGQDSYDMTRLSTYLEAIRQSGATSIVGDHVIRMLGNDGAVTFQTFLGPGLPELLRLANGLTKPVVGAITDPAEAIGTILMYGDRDMVENLQSLLTTGVNVGERFGPGLWWFKVALDRTVRDQMHQFDPDWENKKARDRQRRYEKFGQEY